MDVIALAEAGFKGAVAPLGTAITEEQLQLLWRIHDEPVIALDGDAAGVRAALRVMDLALPRLEAGKGLRFALLPGGQDPDDLLRSKGAPAMQALLDEARPMVRLLWERETAGKVLDSPERKAALDKALRQAIATIRDPSIRGHYGEEIRRLRWELWGPKERPAWRPGRKGPAGPSPARASALALGARPPEDELRQAVLAMLVVTPELIPAFADEVEALDCPDPGQAALRDALLRHAGAADLRAALVEELGADGIERHLASAHILSVRRPGEPEAARLDIAEALAKLAARRNHRAALEEAVEDLDGADEWLTRRLGHAAAQVDVTRRKETEDSRESVVFDNGYAVDKADKERRDQVFSQIDVTRGGRGGHRRGG
jgi:DNA primase